MGEKGVGFAPQSKSFQELLFADRNVGDGGRGTARPNHTALAREERPLTDDADCGLVVIVYCKFRLARSLESQRIRIR
jgi:hypothetical protein